METDVQGNIRQNASGLAVRDADLDAIESPEANQQQIVPQGEPPDVGGSFNQDRHASASDQAYGNAPPKKGHVPKKRVKRVEPGERQAAMVMRDVEAEFNGGSLVLSSGTYVEILDVEGDVARCRVFTGHSGKQATIAVSALHQQPAISEKDRDKASLDALTYQQYQGILWTEDGPKAVDVDQGRLSSCYILGTAAALARKNPDAIKNLFSPQKDGEASYTVNIFQRNGDQLVPTAVTVDTYFPSKPDPVMGAPSPIYAGNKVAGGRAVTPGRSDVALWPLLLEKAFASLDKSDKGGYESLDSGGRSVDAMEMLTGKGADVSTGWTSAKVAVAELRRLNRDHSVTCNTKGDGDGGGTGKLGDGGTGKLGDGGDGNNRKTAAKLKELGFKGWHFYSFHGFTPDGLLKFRDPMGSHHPKPITEEEFVQIFETIQAVGRKDGPSDGSRHGDTDKEEGGTGKLGDGGTGKLGDGGTGG